MKEAKALLVMSLVARRSSAWMHDIVCTSSISDGEVGDDAVQRYTKDIMDALAIFDRADEARRLFEQKAPKTLLECIEEIALKPVPER